MQLVPLGKSYIDSREEPDFESTFAMMWWRLGWEFNGMRLHEYYFDTMGGNGIVDHHNRLGRKKTEDFWQYPGMAKILERFTYLFFIVTTGYQHTF